MRYDENGEKDFRIGKLSYYQTGILFLFIAIAILLFVGYQFKVGRVYSKSGEMPLEPGLPWFGLAIEIFASIVGIVRGIKMIRR
jgi:hypothetical protein